MRNLVPVALVVIVLGCSPEEVAPETPTTCGERLTAWDRLHDAPRGTTTAQLDPRLIRDPAGRGALLASDGDLTTVEWFLAPGEIVLQLDRPLWVTGLRYASAPGGPALTDFQVWLGIDADCYGEPVSVGAFDGTDAPQQVDFRGRMARFIRVALDGGSTPSGDVTIAELGVLVDAGIDTTPPAFAAPGVEWRHEPSVRLPGVSATTLTLRTAPDGMSTDGAVVAWVPRDDQTGSHEVVLAAVSGASELEQRFSVTVSSHRVVTTASVPATGGTVTVTGTGTPLDGMEVDVPASGGSGDVPVEVAVVEGELPAAPPATTAAGVAFSIAADVPDDAAMELRIPISSVTDLPADVDPEGIFVAAYGLIPTDDPGGGRRSRSWLPIFTRVVGGVIESTITGTRRAYYRIVYGRNVVITRRDEFFVKLILNEGESRAGKVERIELIAAQLASDRDVILGEGCTFREEQRVIIRDLSADGVVGWVLPNAAELELNRSYFIDGAYPDPRWRDTVAHELTHVFQWINGGGRPAFARSEHWWLEATAVYNADEVVNLNAFADKYPPFNTSVSRLGLTDMSDGMHRYRLVSFFKSVKAQRGGFNPCSMMQMRRSLGSGMAALDSMMGGPDATLDVFSRYVAGYDFVRTTDLLEDAPLFFPAGTADFAERRNYVGHREYVWTGFPQNPAGGHSARFAGNSERAQDVTVEVISPTSGYVARIFGPMHEQIAEVRPGAASTTLAGWTGVFYVVIAFSQSSTPAFGVDGTFDVKITTAYDCLDATDCPSCLELEGCSFCPGSGCETTENNGYSCRGTPVTEVAACTACSRRGGPCSGSGVAFDDECCDGFICVVGACQDNAGGRERATCPDSSQCARGLACRRVGSETAAATCCARNGDYCELKQDCCGLMECEGNRCRPQLSGEPCLLGDCEGVSFCSSGACT